jgi:hypothetical protein
MGSTNFTEHYDIPLPLGSDKTTPMDYNQSMQAVDTALFTAVGNSQSAVNSVTALAGTVTDLGEDVTALAGRVTQAEGTIGTQGQAIQSNANRIEEVEDDALDMITAVDEGTAQIASVAVNKDKYFRYNNVLYMATQNIAVGDTIVPNTNCRATNVGTELETQAGEIDEIKSDLATDVGYKDYTITSKTYNKGTINEYQVALPSGYSHIIGVVCLEAGGAAGDSLRFVIGLGAYSFLNIMYAGDQTSFTGTLKVRVYFAKATTNLN